MTPFTPDQLAQVFLTRWRAKAMANEFIGYMRSDTFISRVGGRVIRDKGGVITVRVPLRA